MKDNYDDVLDFGQNEKAVQTVSHKRKPKKRSDGQAEKEKTTIYLSPDERKEIKKHAIDLDTSMTEFIVSTVMEKIRRSKAR